MLGSGGGGEAGDVVAQPLSSASSISTSSSEGSHSGLGLRSAFSFTKNLLFDGGRRVAFGGLGACVGRLDLVGVVGADLGEIAVGDHTPGRPAAGGAEQGRQQG